MARPGLVGHRKFRRLVRSLGSVIVARGALELLWDSCYEAGEDYVGTADDIENLVGWTGERGVLTRALAEAGCPEGQGFIEPISDTVDGAQAYRVHDLWHHAPDYVAKRRQRELARQDKVGPSGAVRRTAPNGAGSGFATKRNGVTPSPSPSPSPSPQKISAEVNSAPPAPAVLVFPVVGRHAGDWPLTAEQLAEWAALFPGLDIHAEARKARAWVGANPRNRKTASGMARFLVGWFTRTVNRGGARVPVATGRPPTSEGWDCPHSAPKCLGRWKCHQRTALEEAKRRGVG